MSKQNSKKKITKAERVRWLIGSIYIILTLTLFMYILIDFFWVGSSKEITEVADKFKPQPGWVLESERTNPPTNNCIDAVCPEVLRAWKLPVKIDDKAVFKKYATLDNQSIPITYCLEEDEHYNFDLELIKTVDETCQAKITLGKYSIEVGYTGDSYSYNREYPTIYLHVEEIKQPSVLRSGYQFLILLFMLFIGLIHLTLRSLLNRIRKTP